jgi:hypothetical protein
MKRGAGIVTPESPAALVSTLTSRVDESMVLRESVRITSLPTERLTEIVRMLTDGITVRKATLRLVRAEIVRRQEPPDPKQLEFEFE